MSASDARRSAWRPFVNARVFLMLVVRESLRVGVQVPNYAVVFEASTPGKSLWGVLWVDMPAKVAKEVSDLRVQDVCASVRDAKVVHLEEGVDGELEPKLGKGGIDKGAKDGGSGASAKRRDLVDRKSVV